jgi:hypothetical protein
VLRTAKENQKHMNVEKEEESASERRSEAHGQGKRGGKCIRKEI